MLSVMSVVFVVFVVSVVFVVFVVSVVFVDASWGVVGLVDWSKSVKRQILPWWSTPRRPFSMTCKSSKVILWMMAPWYMVWHCCCTCRGMLANRFLFSVVVNDGDEVTGVVVDTLW